MIVAFWMQQRANYMGEIKTESDKSLITAVQIAAFACGFDCFFLWLIGLFKMMILQCSIFHIETQTNQRGWFIVQSNFRRNALSVLRKGP